MWWCHGDNSLSRGKIPFKIVFRGSDHGEDNQIALASWTFQCQAPIGGSNHALYASNTLNEAIETLARDHGLAQQSP